MLPRISQIIVTYGLRQLQIKLIMKRTIRSTLFLLLLILLTRCIRVEPEVIIEIPDSDFLTALIDEGVDTNGDEEISNREAEEVIYLDVSGHGISDMSGIEMFVNLYSLRV